MNRMLLHLAMPESWNLPALLRDWREDTMVFLRHDVPKILVVVIVSLVLIRVLRALTAKIVALHIRKVPPGFRAQQVRTLATVTSSVGIFCNHFRGRPRNPLAAGNQSRTAAGERRHCRPGNWLWRTDAGERCDQRFFYPPRESVRHRRQHSSCGSKRDSRSDEHAQHRVAR